MSAGYCIVLNAWWMIYGFFAGEVRVMLHFPVDNFGTLVGENLSCYGILSLWAVNGLSIVYWVSDYTLVKLTILKRGLFSEKMRSCWTQRSLAQPLNY